MKDKIFNNWSLKLLSVVLAAIVWVIVVNYDNPYTNRTISGIPIEIVNEHTLTGNNQTYTVNGSQAATVRVRAPRKVAQKLRSSDFRAVADFSKIYSLTNQVPVTVTCSNTRVVDDEITLLTPSLQIAIEEITTRKINVAVKTVGEPAEGYQVGALRASPAIVTVRAPQSIQDQIGSVGVEINVESMSKDFSHTAQLKYYNAVGTELDTTGMNNLSASMTDISVDVEILNVKNVNLVYEVKGMDDVARGYRYSGSTISPESVKISGRRSILAYITNLYLPEGSLDITGASETQTKIFQLSDLELPEGVELVDSPETVISVVMVVEKMATRTFELDFSELHIAFLDENLVINTDENAKLSVTVEGLAADLEALEASEIDAVLNLKGMTAGTQSVIAKVTVPSGFDVLGTATIQLDLVPRETSTTASEPENQVGARPSKIRAADTAKTTEAAVTEADEEERPLEAAAESSRRSRKKESEENPSKESDDLGIRSGEGDLE